MGAERDVSRSLSLSEAEASDGKIQSSSAGGSSTAEASDTGNFQTRSVEADFFHKQKRRRRLSKAEASQAWSKAKPRSAWTLLEAEASENGFLLLFRLLRRCFLTWFRSALESVVDTLDSVVDARETVDVREIGSTEFLHVKTSCRVILYWRPYLYLRNRCVVFASLLLKR